jgi:glycosyltransferase involved in cell wall biosynthesis
MVVGGPAENYVARCLESINNQTYKNWACQVILDPVEDNTYVNAIKYQNEKIKIKLNETRQYNIANFLDATKLLKPIDEDVMIMIDADDWLATPEAFSIVASKYEKNPRLLLTHGTWRSHPVSDMSNNFPYTREDFQNRIRKATWKGSHLKTFKYKLWKRLKDEDLRDPSGRYFTVTGDLIMMFPLIEMAGYGRVEFIPEVLYIYNMETPANDAKQRFNDQVNNDRYIRSRPAYEILGEI